MAGHVLPFGEIRLRDSRVSGGLKLSGSGYPQPDPFKCKPQ